MLSLTLPSTSTKANHSDGERFSLPTGSTGGSSRGSTAARDLTPGEHAAERGAWPLAPSTFAEPRRQGWSETDFLLFELM